LDIHDNGSDRGSDFRLVFWLNLGFTILELIGGLVTNSIAILSNAIHDLGDSLSLGLAWYLNTYSEREKDERYSYGYHRFSLLGAFINSIILISGSLYILSQAIPRLVHPETPDAQGMILFAVLGILINGFAVLRIRRGSTLNAQVIAWHLLEDVLGWAAIFVVSIILLFVDLPILDPILSIMITLYVLYNVMKKLKTTLSVFMQAVPKGININKIKSKLRELEHVRSIHHTHLWSLDGEHHVLTTHVVVDEGTPRDEVIKIKNRIRKISEQYEISHTTIDVEYGKNDCVSGRQK
jgi:cobalt-zinc-cadmium efflux system protein